LPHEERELIGVFKVNLEWIRESIVNSRMSAYARKKLLKWVDAQQDRGLRISDVEEKYTRRFLAGIAMTIASERNLDCVCRTCGAPVARSEMTKEAWSYHINPLFAGTGHFLRCPSGHALFSVQESIS